MERQIIIAGHSRAGTTLFYNMLRSTLKGFELPDRETMAAETIGKPGNYCTKRPLDILEMPYTFSRNFRKKQVDLIIALRDPRELLVSKHKSVPDDYFSAADFMYFSPKGKVPTFNNPGIIPVHNGIMQVARDRMTFPRGVFLLRYENLVDDPERIQQQLAEGLELEFEGNFSDFHKKDIPENLSRALNGVRPVERASQAKWKLPEHRRRVIDQFQRFPELHRVMAESGYATDDEWLKELIEEEAATAT